MEDLFRRGPCLEALVSRKLVNFEFGIEGSETIKLDIDEQGRFLRHHIFTDDLKERKKPLRNRKNLLRRGISKGHDYVGGRTRKGGRAVERYTPSVLTGGVAYSNGGSKLTSIR